MTPDETAGPAEQQSPVWRWWKSLSSDRGGRAELRRCGSTAEVAFTAPYHRLLKMLGSRLGERDARRVAMAAAVLAHIERDAPPGGSPARTMGRPAGEGRGATVSDSRFRTLLRTDNPDELMRDLVRVVRQLDRAAPVVAVFNDVVRWDERTRMRWAREYFEAAPHPHA